MADPNSSYGSARRMEEGRVVVCDGSLEKPEVQTPSTVGGSTLIPSGRSSTTKSALQGLQSWMGDVMKTIKPRKAFKPNISVRTLEDFPMGYPRMSCYLDSDEAFMMYRRFGLLHSRLLLYKQDELREMEEDLYTMDKRDEKTEEGQNCLKSRDEDEARDPPSRGRTRKQLLTDIKTSILEYGQILLQAQQLAALNKPSDRDYASVATYIENDQPLMETDRGFIKHKEDLVAIKGGRENAWLDAAVESVLRWYPCKPMKMLFCSKETSRKSTDASIHYFTRSRINFLVTLIITLIILVVLCVPIAVLYWLTVNMNTKATDWICMGVLLLSTLIFSSVLSLFTKARRHEILAAAAGYCAVLVVFVGNVGSTGLPSG